MDINMEIIDADKHALNGSYYTLSLLYSIHILLSCINNQGNHLCHQAFGGNLARVTQSQ